MPKVIKAQVPVRNDSDYYERVETRGIPARSGQREQYYKDRPSFLSHDCERDDSKQLVVRERQSDTFNRRHRFSSPVRSRERYLDGEQEQCRPIERRRTGISEGERSRIEERHVRRERHSSPVIEPVRRRSRSPSLVDDAESDESIRTPRHQKIDEVIWDLSRTKDVTMHLELDITEDLELDLDEFCRLGRLGNFHQAKQFFRDNLEQHMDDPYIFVQYAQMLMEMGDHLSIEALNVPYSLEESENDLLQTNWRLIQSLSTLRTKGWVDRNDKFFAQKAARAIACVLPGSLDVLRVRVEVHNERTTIFPASIVSRRAIIDLGYPFEKEVGVRRSPVHNLLTFPGQ
jgi:hypothetical protein